MFLWKALHRALPTMVFLSQRGLANTATCPICEAGDEDVIHTLFRCSLARQLWFASSLAIRSDCLMGTLSQIIDRMMHDLDEEQLGLFLNLIWCIWKERCKRVLEGSTTPIGVTLSQAMLLQSDAKSMGLIQFSRSREKAQEEQYSIQDVDEEYACYCDGSYKFPDCGGVGYVLYHGTSLIQYSYQYMPVLSPLHSEAAALKEALIVVHAKGIKACKFFTDSKQLVAHLNSKDPPIAAEWQAHKVVLQLYQFFRFEPSYECMHIDRKCNGIAHNLANQGRIARDSYTGFTFPT